MNRKKLLILVCVLVGLLVPAWLVYAVTDEEVKATLTRTPLQNLKGL